MGSFKVIAPIDAKDFLFKVSDKRQI